MTDVDDTTIAEDEVETLRAAKARAKLLLSDEWASSAETTHEDLGTYKVSIFNYRGECVADYFA